jgi:hypothetical protein
MKPNPWLEIAASMKFTLVAYQTCGSIYIFLLFVKFYYDKYQLHNMLTNMYFIKF